MTLREASIKWGISVRRINLLCSEGRIPGALKRQNLWLIPAAAEKPADGRRRSASLKEPFVLFWNVTYPENHRPQDICEYDRAITRCQVLFLKGDYEECIASLRKFENSCTDKRYLLLSYNILRLTSNLAGDKSSLDIAASSINRLLKDPEAGDLTRVMTLLNDFNNQQPALPGIDMSDTIMEELVPYVSLMDLMRSVTAELKAGYPRMLISEELICRSLKERNCPQLYVYYNVYLAVYYYITGLNQYAETHLKEALNIAVPRSWYTPFAQYCFVLDLDFINAEYHAAYTRIRYLADKIVNSYARLNIYSPEFNRSHADNLISFQVAYQIARGNSNSAIAANLGISRYKVEKIVSEVYLRTGFSTRSELKDYMLSHLFL